MINDVTLPRCFSSRGHHSERQERVQEWQALPQAQMMTEEAIAAEVAAYRASKK